VADDDADFAARIELGLPETLAANECFTTVADNRPGVQPESAQRPYVQAGPLPADGPMIRTLTPCLARVSRARSISASAMFGS